MVTERCHTSNGTYVTNIMWYLWNVKCNIIWTFVKCDITSVTIWRDLWLSVRCPYCTSFILLLLCRVWPGITMSFSISNKELLMLGYIILQVGLGHVYHKILNLPVQSSYYHRQLRPIREFSRLPYPWGWVLSAVMWKLMYTQGHKYGNTLQFDSFQLKYLYYDLMIIHIW